MGRTCHTKAVVIEGASHCQRIGTKAAKGAGKKNSFSSCPFYLPQVSSIGQAQEKVSWHKAWVSLFTGVSLQRVPSKTQKGRKWSRVGRNMRETRPLDSHVSLGQIFPDMSIY